MSSPAASAFDYLFGDPSWGSVWTGFLTATLVASLVWSYALLFPLSVMPAQRGAFGFLRSEKAALRIPRQVAFLLQKAPRVTLEGAGEWNQLRSAMALDYSNHRHVHGALFCAARALVVPATATAVGFSLLCFTYALREGSGPAAWLGGASMTYAAFPFVITTMAARYRWRRRAPFELLWLHESIVVLARHEKQIRLKILERAEVLSDIADMEFILMQRYRGSGTGTAAEMARKHWAARVLSHTSEAASFHGQPRPTSAEVWLWLFSHIDRLSAAINEHQPVATSTTDVRGTPRRRLTYSADRAGSILLVFLTLVLAAFLVGTAWSAGVRLSTVPWERIPLLLATATSLLPILGAVSTFIQILRKGRGEL